MNGSSDFSARFQHVFINSRFDKNIQNLIIHKFRVGLIVFNYYFFGMNSFQL
ncbi:unnamed protein product [Arabidopsis halleri]